jgi:hypothetical protein
MSKTSVVENYYLTAPGFRESRWEKKVVPHAPWSYVGEVASGISSPNINIQETLTKLLKEKYDSRKVDEAVSKGWELSEAYRHSGSGMGRFLEYAALAYAEKLLVNPGWEGKLYNETPPIPVTFEDKHLSGKYTQTDTENFERIKTRELNDGLVKDHGLEGLFGGLHRRRKTKQSKRGGKKRKTTLKH